MWRTAWLVLGLAACDGEMTGGTRDGGGFTDRDGGGVARDGGVFDAAAIPDGGPGVDGGVLPPPETLACNDNGTCELGETCASCRADCGSCDVGALTMQRAKYVDLACETNGDGLTDECASSAGGPGRFNELQGALDSLVAGDTLYVYPGDYWRDVTGRDSGGVFTMSPEGTAAQPVVVTARFGDRMPVIHSCNPGNPSECPMAALASYGSYTILDHLHIRGRVQIWGGMRQTMQYLECTRGWGVGDGNNSCLRIEGCTNCLAHHNYVHSIEGDIEDPDRPSGLKEFESDGAIWEFNTVLDAPHWAYDLHRNSENVTVRFNFFAGWNRHGVLVHRTRNVAVYGNALAGAASGGGACVGVHGLNERVAGEPHRVDIHHNVCVSSQTGYHTSELATFAHENVASDLRSVGEHPRSVIIENGSEVDYNAYDSNGDYRRIEYDAPVYATLAEWREVTGGDENSVDGPGGACAIAGAPTDRDPSAFRVVEGTCRTLGRDGTEVGPWGATDCVGHTCP